MQYRNYPGFSVFLLTAFISAADSYRTSRSAVTGMLFAAVLLGSVPALPGPAAASDVRVSAALSSDNVTVGEQLTLRIDVFSREPRDVGRPELPELNGLRYVSTVPRTSTSYSLVNGVAQMTYRYSYTLAASDSGAYQIPPVYIDIDGEEYRTNAMTVVVRSGEAGDPQRPATSDPDWPPIFLDLELSEEEPVRGQQIVAEIVLYFRNTIEVSSFNITSSWQTEGFWREDLNESPTRRPESVVLGGREYRRAVLSRYALFPTRSGELTVPSFSIRASVRQSGRFQDQFSAFFQGFGRQRDVNLETMPRTLHISAPPTPPSGGQHISALGQFTVERTLSQERVKLGEAVDVITEIRGSGNLGLITRPDYDYPQSFDTHRPREVIDRDNSAPRMSGTKQFRDVLIARNVGEFTIPESVILVYNDARRQYERQVLPELTLEVVRDPNARIMIAQNDDFRLTPVRGSVSWRQEPDTPFFFLWWFWLVLVVPFVLFIWGYRTYRYRSKLTADHDFYRYEQAWHNAVALLDDSAREQDVKKAYSGIYKAISNFITDRLHLPSAGQTVDQLVNELYRRNVESQLTNRVRHQLNKSATIRYAPDPSAGDIAADIAEAKKIIAELKIQL